MNEKLIRPSLSFLMLVVLAVQSFSQSNPALFGFDNSSSTTQRSLEARFDSLLSANNLRDWMKRLTARPHHLGSAYNKDNADFIASLFRSWGYETKLEQFEVLFPTPKTRIVEMIAPERFTLRLKEPAVEGDPTTAQQNEQLPSYNAYSIDGDVTAALVYVNYGIPADYDELEKRH
jgi:N-acetylated-alpha-linked acidic dipeptidase